MPTGYTAKLAEEGQTFEEFVMTCARAFGACIDMRDDSLTKPIPEEFKPRQYYVEAKDAAFAKLLELSSMKEYEKLAYGTKRQQEDIANIISSINRMKDSNNRLAYMLSLVRMWTPPTPDHAELKKFMEGQLTSSIESLDWPERALQKYKDKEPLEYYYDDIKAKENNIKYYSEQYEKEVKRCAERSLWVRQLRESLKGEKTLDKTQD